VPTPAPASTMPSKRAVTTPSRRRATTPVSTVKSYGAFGWNPGEGWREE
jgi:hypothetical protein